MKLRDRAAVIYDLGMAYASLVEAGAPGDVLRGVAYWLRVASQEGLTEADLEHALDSVTDAKVSPLARRDAP